MMLRTVRRELLMAVVALPTFLCLTISAGCWQTADALAGEFTSLTNPPCKTRNVQIEGANSEQACPGVLGYQLLLLDSDGRMSATIAGPKGARYALDFWSTVTPHFSSFGKRAEWRTRKEGTASAPTAVILPLNVNEDPDSNAVTSYLVVARIVPDKACVVGKFKDNPEGRIEARKAADDIDQPKCLTP